MQFASVTGPGWRYKFTTADWRWACRMLVGEAGRKLNTDAKQAEGEAILWTMLNRLYLLRNLYTTYTDLILAYSQPINPKWRNRGTAEEQARRAEFATMTTFDPSITDLVTRFMQGKVPGEPYAGLVHFIAPGVTPAPEAIGPVAVARVAPNRSNIFFKVGPTQDWSGDLLKMMFKPTPTWVYVVVVTTATAVGLYAWQRLRT